MNPLELLEQYRAEMTKSELTIADYITENPLEVTRYTLTQLAKRSGSSNAAIIRLCQKLGYEGFSEFKFSISKFLVSNVSGLENSDKNPIQEITNTYIQYISQIPCFVTEQDIRALANFINNARHITIWGMNRTFLPASQLNNRLLRMGIPSLAACDIVQMSDLSNIYSKGDLCILFTIAGKGSPLYPELFQRLKERGCTTALITMSPKLKVLNKYADLSLVLPFIGQNGTKNFYDDQAIYLVFIELLLYEIAAISQAK